MPHKRLFFALWPTDRQREALRDPVKAALAPVEGRLVPRTNWHVTLVFLGSFPEARIAELVEAASAIPVDSFRLRFDRLEYWPRSKSACLLASAVPPALQQLVGELEAVAAGFGREPEDRVFRPHLTVARNVRHFTSEPLAQPVMLEWDGFELVESETLPEGARYTALKQGATPTS